MTGERCYEIWAPDTVAWSAWAKPVPFSQMDTVWFKAQPIREFTDQLPRFGKDTAVIVDVEGHEAVVVGLALARQGWRPVPLFNATMAPKALVDTGPVMGALVSGAELLEGIEIRPDAPPAFLIDLHRMDGLPKPGTYDNRSIVLPQDFPSATMLITRGIREVVLVQLGTARPKEDLAHVLVRWQQAGIELRYAGLRGEEGKLVVSPPSYFRKVWHRMIALMGLRRSNVGGFGAAVPEATSGGYG